MNLNHVIDQVSKEKGISREILIETLEAAILSAAKKTYGQQREIEAKFNDDTGEVDLFQVIVVVDDVMNPYQEVSYEEIYEAGFVAEVGDELLFQIFYRDEDAERAKRQDERYGALLRLNSYDNRFGRIAALYAKQVINQRVREAERDIIFREYENRVGEMITGSIRRFEKGNIIVNLGRTEAILPRREQVPREDYRPNERIQAMIKSVRKSSREPQVVLTRADPQLLFELFAIEVPEINEGIVRIVAVAREAGVRSKVAVYSRESEVDPVGACVGVRGARVQAIVQELGGEKIDVVPYSEESARFVTNAISPAEVTKVLIDETNMTMELIVPDDQLSLAIGRGGQNVRLAAQLTGWNLDIISETRLRHNLTEARNDLLEYEGVTEDMVDDLFQLGYNKLQHIAAAEEADVAQLPGWGADRAELVISAAKEILQRPTRNRETAELTQEERAVQKLHLIPYIGEKLAFKLVEKGEIRRPNDLAFVEDLPAFAEKVGVPLEQAKKLVESAYEHIRDENKLDDEGMEKRRTHYLNTKKQEAEGGATGESDSDDDVLSSVNTELEKLARASAKPLSSKDLGGDDDSFDDE